MIDRSRSISLLSARSVANSSPGSSCQVDSRTLARPEREPRQGRIGVGLIQANFDVAQTDTPAPNDVIRVVLTIEKFAKPGRERQFQSFDLRRTFANDGLRCRMAHQFRVEVLDEWTKVGLGQTARDANSPFIVAIPAHVALKIAIMFEKFFGKHGDGFPPMGADG